MKQLITKLLLVVSVIFGCSVSSQAFNLILAGSANFMDTKTPQSGLDGWKLPGVSQSCGDTGDFYFWATGNFKPSQYSNAGTTDWDEFNGAVFGLNNGTIDWNHRDVTNLGEGTKFVHLHIAPNNQNKVTVSDTPFAGHEGVWAAEAKTYTIYYYDTEVTPLTGLKAHIWGASDITGSWGSDDQNMTPTGKYVLKNGTYYPVWSKTFTTSVTPQHVIIYYGDNNDKLCGGDDGVDFVDGGFYSKDCTSAEAANAYTLVDKPVITTHNYKYYFNYGNPDGTDWTKPEIQMVDGKLTVTMEDLQGKKFSIRVTDGDTEVGYYSCTSSTDTSIEAGKTKTFPIEKVQNGNDIQFPADLTGRYKIIVNLGDDNLPVSVSITAPQGAVVDPDDPTDPTEVPETGTYLFGSYAGVDDSWGLKGTFSESANANKGEFVFAPADHARTLYYVVYKDGKRYGHSGSNMQQKISELSYKNAVKLSQVSSSDKDCFYLTIPANTRYVVKYQTGFVFNDNLNGYSGSGDAVWFEAVPEPKAYYFVGDINDWFSVEFSSPTYKKNDDGTVYRDDNGFPVLDKQGMDADGEAKFEAERDGYKFEYVEEGDYKGWYKFDKFPVVNGKRLLSGQFQITDEGGWNGEVYSHVQKIGGTTTDPDGGDYEKYYTKQIPRTAITAEGGDMISLRSYMRKRGKNNDGSTEGGQNFHLQCNAVENAVIYFKPGETNSCDMVIEGKPVDYYIFYAMRPDTGKEVGGTVTAKTLTNKPNVNNYYLPGIMYSGWGKGKPLPSPRLKPNGDIDLNSDGNGQYWMYSDKEGTEGYDASRHMCMPTGIDLVYINLDADNARAELEKVIVDETIVDNIINNNQLPNGRYIPNDEKGHYIYVTKIPSGFENPAGYKYNMQFTDQINNVNNQQYTLETAHMYFLPRAEKFHVHVNKDVLETAFPGYDIDVLYRVYRIKADDNGYSTYVLTHNDEDGSHSHLEKALHNPVTNPVKPTHLYDANAEERTLGWVHLDSKAHQKMWLKGSAAPHPYLFEEWHYNKEKNLESNNNTDDAWEIDERHAIGEEYNYAYVQFKIVYTPKNRSNGPARAGSMNGDDIYEVFLPSQLDTERDDEHTLFEDGDIYRAFDNTDIATGIEDILDWEDEDFDGDAEGENAAPVYYNLQGVRVANPTKGLYIKVTGSKSEKVMF